MPSNNEVVILSADFIGGEFNTHSVQRFNIGNSGSPMERRKRRFLVASFQKKSFWKKEELQLPPFPYLFRF